MSDVTIWLKDDTAGSEPLPASVRKEGEFIRIECDLFLVRMQIEQLLSLLGDEGHG